MRADIKGALDLLSSFADAPSVSGDRALNFSMDVHGTAGMLMNFLPVDLPTLPGFRMPDFRDFDPLALVANASGASRVGAAADLAAYRATISDGVVRGGALISTAAFELTSIGISLVRNAAAAPAIAATPAGPLGAAAYVAGLIASSLESALQVLRTLETDLQAIANTLTTATNAALARVMPGPGPVTEKALGDLERLAAQIVPTAQPAPAPAPPVVNTAATVAPPPTPAPVQAASLPTEPTPMQAPDSSAPAGSPVGAAAAQAAKTQIGAPYVWGGAAPGGFDCSGLTSWAYKQAGLDIPRVAADQTVGRQVSYEELQPGDLVLWSGHAAMYTGDGMMVEAGSPVQMNPVRTENLGMTFRGFWRPTG